MEDARDLRQRGIRAAKAGEKDEARQLLQLSIRLEPENEAAWLWLASVSRDNRERVFCLQKLLEINPENETARKALAAANQAPEPTIKRLPNAPVTKATVPDIAAQQPGVPVPMPDRIAEAQKQAEPIIHHYLTPLPSSTKWVHKTRQRAGEGDILIYRTYVAIGVLAVLLVLIVAGVIVVQTNDDVREIVLGPSATPTPSPTITPTNTPGLTPTASITPRFTPTPSVTVPPNILAASPPALPHATEIYPQILERSVFNSVLLMGAGNYDRAVPTLDHERKLTFDTRLNPNPYYYEALALAGQGYYDDAIQTLDEAADRLDERPSDLWIAPFLDSGYAQVYWMQAQAATADGNPAVARNLQTQAAEKAQSAIDGDGRLAVAYLVLAQIDSANRQYSDAIEVLNQGLNVYELTSDTELIMARAQVYFDQRNYDRAQYQAFLALYIDPSIEPAYQMKVKIALARSRPGDAVLAAQDYLYYYPGSTEAFRLLGEAREAEGKDDLALAAYDQGLAGNGTDAGAQAMLEARAQIYDRQGRYTLALADYNRLYQITNDSRTQGLRMQAAFAAGDYAQASADADNLSGQGVVPAGIVELVKGGSLVEQAVVTDRGAYQQAVHLLDQAIISTGVAGTDLAGVANEYLARAQMKLGDTEAALTAINAALAVEETGSRHYLRGQIREAAGDTETAQRDYEWVIAWSEIYDYPFRAEAQDRLDVLRG